MALFSQILTFGLQLCGYRGESNTTARTLFWQARKGISFVVTFESERDRNAAIMLARRYALDCNVSTSLAEPLIALQPMFLSN